MCASRATWCARGHARRRSCAFAWTAASASWSTTRTPRRPSARYVEPARAAGFRVVGYLVEIDVADALARNERRSGRERVPVAGVVGTSRRLQRPTLEEGFDELWHATSAEGGGWRIEPLLVTPPLF
jgi:hypothetical protein